MSSRTSPDIMFLQPFSRLRLNILSQCDGWCQRTTIPRTMCGEMGRMMMFTGNLKLSINTQRTWNVLYVILHVKHCTLDWSAKEAGGAEGSGITSHVSWDAESPFVVLEKDVHLYGIWGHRCCWGLPLLTPNIRDKRELLLKD